MDSIGVGELKNLTPSRFRTYSACPWFTEPAVGQRRISYDAYPRISGRRLPSDLSGAVGRRIIHHDELELRICRRKNRPHAARDVLCFVASGNQQREERR